MSRRDRQAAKQRIEKKQRHQRELRGVELLACPFERDRLTARHQRELEGHVDVGRTRPHYLRHLGLLDVLTRPPTEDHPAEHPPVIRGHRVPK